MMNGYTKDLQYVKFCAYGFLKNLRFFDAFFILFLVDKGLSYTQIGVLYGIREIVINLSEIPTGIVADTYGRKNSLTVSFLFYIISFAVFYYSAHFSLFLVAFVLYGVADAFRTGTHKGMIITYLKMNNWEDQKINYYGHTRSWSQKGSAISSLIAGVILYYGGDYQSIFLYSVFPYLINLLLIISYPKELNFATQKIAKKNRPSLFEVIKSTFKIIKIPKVLQIINETAIHTAFLKAVKDYIQPLMLNIALLLPFLTDSPIEKKNGIVVGVLYFVIYLITSRASQLAAKIAKNRNRTISYTTLLIGFAFGIIGGIAYSFHLWIIAIVAIVGIYVIENIRKPIMTGFIADNVPTDTLTSVISVQSLLRTLMTAIIAIGFGVIADYFGIGMAFIVSSSMLIVVTIIIKSLIKKAPLTK